MGTDDADPNADRDTVAGFAATLRELRIAAGEPPYRTLAARSGYSRATVHEALAGRRLPTLETTLAVVESLGGDPGEWRTRWISTRTATSGGGPRTPDPTPQHAPAAGLAADHPAPRQVTPDGSADRSPAEDPAADPVADPVASWMPSVQELAREHPTPTTALPVAKPVSPAESAPVDPPRQHRRALIGAAVVTALITTALTTAWLVQHAQSPPDPGHTPPGSSPTASSCQDVPRYRLIDDGDLLEPAGDAVIGSVRTGDLVDLLYRGDSAHPYRFRVLVERTGQIGTVDVSKLTGAGTHCAQLPG